MDVETPMVEQPHGEWDISDGDLEASAPAVWCHLGFTGSTICGPCPP